MIFFFDLFLVAADTHTTYHISFMLSVRVFSTLCACKEILARLCVDPRTLAKNADTNNEERGDCVYFKKNGNPE